MEVFARDGDFNIEINREFNRVDRFSIDFVEYYILDEELNTKANNGNRIRVGVEVDDFGKAVANHLLREPPGDRHRGLENVVWLPGNGVSCGPRRCIEDGLHYQPRWRWLHGR